MTKTHTPDDFHGATSWQSPSNIALVKYWGKRHPQLPMNPSISLTLKECRTVMRTSFEASEHFNLDFRFEGKTNKDFAEKIKRFLINNKEAFPFIDELDICIDSHNTFPHSSGIASSASSMSALVMTMLDIERQLNGTDIDIRRASYYARLASGSASRSVVPQLALWGKTEYHNDSSDEYAIDIHNEVDAVFNNYHDTIIIVNDEKKKVSSTDGHKLMDTNAFATTRYQEANKHIAQLLNVMKEGDTQSFCEIVEAEALQLHAMMMCSTPSYLLIKPDTLKIINSIREYRLDTMTPLCFTLDAGPNVHLLYPDECRNKAEELISTLKNKMPHIKYIDDKVGNGPSRL